MGTYVEYQLCNNYLALLIPLFSSMTPSVSLHSLFLENKAQIGFKKY